MNPHFWLGPEFAELTELPLTEHPLLVPVLMTAPEPPTSIVIGTFVFTLPSVQEATIHIGRAGADGIVTLRVAEPDHLRPMPM